MKAFRFTLARLLGIRERAERDAAVALAKSRNTEAALLTQLQHSSTERDAARATLLPLPGQTTDVASLSMIAFSLEHLDRRIKALGQRCRIAAEETRSRHATLIDRIRDRRVLERLRDRQFAAWRAENDRRDRETMDAFRPRAGLEPQPSIDAPA